MYINKTVKMLQYTSNKKYG